MLVGISNHLWQSTLFTAGFLAADSCIAEGPGGGAVAALAPRLPEIPGSLFPVRQLGQFAWISALLPRRRWRRCHWPWIRSANRSPRQSHRSRCRPQSGPRMGFSSAVCDLAVRLPRQCDCLAPVVAGLELQSRKGPLPTVVIEGIERPTEN